MRISDWSSDVCSSDLVDAHLEEDVGGTAALGLREELNEHRAPDPVPPVPGVDRDRLDVALVADDAQARIAEDRKSVVEGKSVAGRVDHGGRRNIKKKNKIKRIRRHRIKRSKRK